MELRHLRYFVAVAEELHFGRAAARLHVSQPPLSQQIRRLEDELGVRLFDRTTQEVRLTEAGRAFLPEARATLTQAEHAIRAARAAAREEVERIEVAFLVTLDHNTVARILERFRRRFPRVSIGLAQMTSVEQLAALRRGRIDAGFVRLPLSHRGLECEVVAREPFFAVLPAHHRLARRRRIDLGDLNGEPFVSIEAKAHPKFHAVMLDLCRRAGFEPRIAHESARLQNVVVMVSGGLGVSLVPESVTAFRTPGVVFRRLSGVGAEPVLRTGVLYRPGPHSSALTAFLDDVRHYASGT